MARKSEKLFQIARKSEELIKSDRAMPYGDYVKIGADSALLADGIKQLT